MDDSATPLQQDPKFGFKPREFALGLVVATMIVLSVAGTRWYVRARTSSALSNCQIHLKQLQSAKEAWALKHSKRAQDVPIWTDLVGPRAFIGRMPVCSQQGEYSLGPVGQAPRCSIKDHVLP